jgi:hypothetical protein
MQISANGGWSKQEREKEKEKKESNENVCNKSWKN